MASYRLWPRNADVFLHVKSSPVDDQPQNKHAKAMTSFHGCALAIAHASLIQLHCVTAMSPACPQTDRKLKYTAIPCIYPTAKLYGSEMVA